MNGAPVLSGVGKADASHEGPGLRRETWGTRRMVDGRESVLQVDTFWVRGVNRLAV